MFTLEAAAAPPPTLASQSDVDDLKSPTLAETLGFKYILNLFVLDTRENSYHKSL